MADSPASQTLDRSAAADLWRRTLASIPSLFGRLVYLSSLRNINTGEYEHQGLALRFGDCEAHRALLHSHEANFGEWLNYSLLDKKADLDLYLSSLASGRRAAIEAWLRLAPDRALAPASARVSERDLFVSDFRALMEALRRECDVPAPDPEEP